MKKKQRHERRTKNKLAARAKRSGADLIGTLLTVGLLMVDAGLDAWEGLKNSPPAGAEPRTDDLTLNQQTGEYE